MRVILGRTNILDLRSTLELLSDQATLDVVCAATEPHELDTALAKNTVDVVLLDEDLFHRLRTAHPKWQSVPVTLFRRSGANAAETAVVSEDADGTAIAATLGEVSRIASQVSLPHTVRSLTKREREIAELIARGRTNQQIADELGLCCQTVKNVIGRILRKRRCTNRVQIAREQLQAPQEES